MYDAAEFFFKERGAEMFVARTADATDPVLSAALLTFARDLGPGQVSAPGRITPSQQLMLAVHAEANNRIAIIDGPDTPTPATLTAAATIAGITANQERYSAMFAPNVVVPPLTTGGANRTIAPSAIVAGLMARRDAEGVTPNQPAAGLLGESEEGLNVSQNYIDVDRTTFNLNGINILRPMYDGVRVYGYRTLADPVTDPDWKNLSNARLFMAIQAQADAVMERYVFRQLDGQRQTINEFGGALTGVLLPFWSQGSLYGITPEEAFRVDVGPNVNTDVTIAAGELHANIALRVSEFAEEVILELVKVRVTEAV
jgi:phage tail sheath protein FI